MNRRDEGSLARRLSDLPVVALNIKNVIWCNHYQKRIALIEIAYCSSGGIKVNVINRLALENLERLRQLLEQQATLKVICNAAFDAVRRQTRYQFRRLQSTTR